MFSLLWNYYREDNAKNTVIFLIIYNNKNISTYDGFSRVLHIVRGGGIGLGTGLHYLSAIWDCFLKGEALSRNHMSIKYFDIFLYCFYLFFCSASITAHVVYLVLLLLHKHIIPERFLLEYPAFILSVPLVHKILCLCSACCHDLRLMYLLYENSWSQSPCLHTNTRPKKLVLIPRKSTVHPGSITISDYILVTSFCHLM